MQNVPFPLKQACQLTGARWAALVWREADEWCLGPVEGLSKSRREALHRLVREARSAASLGGALAGGKPRLLTVSAADGLDCARVYVFPTRGGQLALAAAETTLTTEAQAIWKLLAACLAEPAPAAAEVSLLQDTVLELQQTQQELQARISAQREAEARLIQAAKLAAVGEMAAGVAHELNNPLTTVVGFTELALEELPLDSLIRNDLDLVLKEARRARSVVRRLLDFARQAESVRVKTNLNEIVEDVFMLTKHSMQTSQVLAELHLASDLPWVTVDRDQIKQVVINLVNNALYAMPDGGRLVIETAEQARYSKQWLTLLIQDTGVGIAAENLGRIFEPFFTTRGDRGGTGLGLSVTYGIVTDHAGMIEVESQPLNGSTFTVWLPLEASA
jgi:signal transduction histidine kinase